MRPGRRFQVHRCGARRRRVRPRRAESNVDMVGANSERVLFDFVDGDWSWNSSMTLSCSTCLRIVARRRPQDRDRRVARQQRHDARSAGSVMRIGSLRSLPNELNDYLAEYDCRADTLLPRVLKSWSTPSCSRLETAAQRIRNPRTMSIERHGDATNCAGSGFEEVLRGQYRTAASPREPTRLPSRGVAPKRRVDVRDPVPSDAPWLDQARDESPDPTGRTVHPARRPWTKR